MEHLTKTQTPVATPMAVAAPTARQIIEARLGRPLGAIAAMSRDLRRAMYLLALQLIKARGGEQ